MVTLEHVKTLSPTELKILIYMDLTDKTLSITQETLAKEINVNIRSIREALKLLEARGIISYKRSIISSTKSVITIQQEDDETFTHSRGHVRRRIEI